MKYRVTYTVHGSWYSDQRTQDREFRSQYLLSDQPAIVSYTALSCTVLVMVDHDLAMMFRLKFGGSIDPTT